MRGRDLEPSLAQILNRRTAQSQLQIRSWKLNPGPQLPLSAHMQRLCVELDSQRRRDFQDGGKAGVALP